MRFPGMIALIASLAACASTHPRYASFSGTYRGNEADSLMLPGEHVPKDFVYVIEDDGRRLKTVQTFTAIDGKAVRLVWDGPCDEKERPIEGALPPGMRMSCRRARDGALVNTVSGEGWSYTETCVLTTKTRMTCAGTMADAAGNPQPFSYALDRQRNP
jgi:hypothetical protein